MITVGLAAFAKPNNSTRIAAASNFTNYNGVLVEPCSIMKPLIKFEGVQVWNYNYAYISQFSRYYFIDDYYTENGFWFAQMTVDVLASFKTYIGSSTQYIERAANKQNAYALDRFYPTTGKYTETIQTVNSSATLIDDFSDGIFAINVTGSGEDIVATYLCDYVNFKKVLKALYACGSDPTSWTNLGQGLINSLFEPMKHIGSVIWFPNCWWMDGWNVAANAKTQIFIGLWFLAGQGDDSFTIYKSSGLLLGNRSFTKMTHPQAASYGTYLNLEPFSRYIYSDPVFGDIQLNPSHWLDSSTYSLRKWTDPSTGQQLVMLPDGQYRIGQAGYLIPMENNSLNLGGVISSVGTTARGIMTSDPINTVSGALGAVTDFLQPNVTQASTSGSMVNYCVHERIIGQFWQTPTQYPARFGKLYCTQASINTVSGYLKCRDAHWQNNKAFADEIQMVETYMNGGMFYE